ncbi:nitrous oxide reductase family maturation protein NosD [Thalassotalea psychrophila]|uniref:Nitrous oxide reductase family maturation protein NosD n=1 Tax=Thalassotalea psychrophila TaxID=3065647 RepID=A0ABY9TSS6_9GAMM|nr:nitrous oxide reductase family maturation protein NosD [Colwelliaceae bacterium SQ149]
MIKKLLLFLFLTMVVSSTAIAKEWQVSPQDNLQQILDSTLSGDVVILSNGTYFGNFSINQAITVRGKQGATIDSQGLGNGLHLHNSNITIEDLTIINWGDDLTEQNSAIYSDKKASNILIQNNQLQGSGFGIWLQKAEHIKVLNNTIIGNSNLRSADRGNGIQLSIVKHVLVRGNNVSNTRDGLYIISSQENVLQNNTMHDLRYGIHYMYSHNNKVLNNLAYNTRAGYALMSSKHLTVSGNTSKNSEDYGFLMNFITSSTITDNVIKNVWTKPENKVLGRDGKGLFVYNSAYNTISNNLINTAEIGIHLTAGSENTKVFGNSFINNPTQVKYVSNKKQEWSQDGKGNYWSNYLGWDMNNDNVGDVIFEPNDGIDKLVWQYPEMKMLMDSPAIVILRWVQKQFPILKPPGVKDSFPLMQSPHQSSKQNNTTSVAAYNKLSDTKH